MTPYNSEISELRLEIEKLKQKDLDLEASVIDQFERMKASINTEFIQIKKEDRQNWINSVKTSANPKVLSSPLASISYLVSKKILDVMEDYLIMTVLDKIIRKKEPN